VGFLNIDLAQVLERGPTTYTCEFVHARTGICLEPWPIELGMAAIALGNEAYNLYAFGAYREGIRKVPGLEACPTGYLDAHLRDEEADYQVCADIFDRIARPELATGGLTTTAIRNLLDARGRWFDGLHADICGAAH
jgi:hypothetical protein